MGGVVAVESTCAVKCADIGARRRNCAAHSKHRVNARGYESSQCGRMRLNAVEYVRVPVSASWDARTRLLLLGVAGQVSAYATCPIADTITGYPKPLSFIRILLAMMATGEAMR